MKGRRLWLRLDTMIGPVPVFVCKSLPDDEDPEKQIFGCFEAEIPHILIRQMDNVQSMMQTLHHELLHVAFGCHSGTTREHALRGRTADGRHKREEEIVSFVEPVQFDLLTRNGFLRYPKPPRVK